MGGYGDMYSPRIIVVDDDLAITKFLRANLLAEGYEILIAIDGVKALQMIEQELPDLVILDISLPGMDGFEICHRLREWSQIPIIMLTARGDAGDKVKCLDLGADDYITKPFAANELLARVRAVLRRVQVTDLTPQPPSFRYENIEVNFVQRKVLVSGNEVKLTPTEYQLLQELVLNAGKVLTHTYLLNKVWGPEYQGEKDYLHVFIRRLRHKIERKPAEPKFIITVPAVGYKFIN
jgi:two-component system, OmpR family, KDP operon response regulator KdpE